MDVMQAVTRHIDERIAEGSLLLPRGTSILPAGTYQNQLRSEARLMVLIPLALSFIFALLYPQFRRVNTKKRASACSPPEPAGCVRA